MSKKTKQTATQAAPAVPTEAGAPPAGTPWLAPAPAAVEPAPLPAFPPPAVIPPVVDEHDRPLPAAPFKRITPVPPPPLPDLPMQAGERRQAKTGAGWPLWWYLVRFKEVGWPALPVLALRDDQDEAIEAYMDQCGLHPTRATVAEKFTVVSRGPAMIEKFEDDQVLLVDVPTCEPPGALDVAGADFILAESVGEIDG